MVERQTDSGLVVVTKGAGTPPIIEQTMARTGMSLGRAFGPGRPIDPMAGYSPDARTWDFQTGYNIVTRPLRDSRVSFDVLKALIDSYDLARIVIGHRIDDIRSLAWSIVPDEDATEDVDGAIRKARAFLDYPGGPGTVLPFNAWLAKWLEDVLRYDAGCLYRRRNRRGDVIGLDVVSGRMIAPLLDYHGRTPMAPAPAYAQYANGVPWGWFTTDDMIYVPFRPQPDSPYGWAPLESAILTANTDVRHQMFLLQYFTEGNVPEGFATAPADASGANQLEELQEYWDALVYGDQAARRQLKWVPAGTTFTWSKDFTFNGDLAKWMTQKVAAAYHCTLNDLGFTDDVNRSTGETQVSVQFRTGTQPLAQYVQGIITSVLQRDLRLPVRFQFDMGQEKEDRLRQAQADEILIRSGVLSPDEPREELGKQVDPSRVVPRFIIVGNQAVPLSTLIDAAGSVDVQTAAPDAPPPAVGPSPTAPPNPAGPIATTPLRDAPHDPGLPTATPVASAANPVAVVKHGSAYAQVRVWAADTGRVMAMSGRVVDTTGTEDAGITVWETTTGTPFPPAVTVVDGDTLHARVPSQTTITVEDGAPVAWDDPGAQVPPAALPALPDGTVGDMARWRTAARARVRKGLPVRAFVSDIIPGPVHGAVWDALAGAEDRGTVDAAFTRVVKGTVVPGKGRGVTGGPASR